MRYAFLAFAERGHDPGADAVGLVGLDRKQGSFSVEAVAECSRN